MEEKDENKKEGWGDEEEKRKMEETGVFMGERVDGLRIHLVTPAITMYVTIMSICIEVEEKTMILNPM